MTIITRKVILAWVVLFFFIISPAYGESSNKNQAEWEIVNYDDQTIIETVTIPGDVTLSMSGWEKTEVDDYTKLTRTVENWQSYNELADKLPIQAKEKNYFLWKKMILIVTDDESNDNSVFAQLMDRQDVNLSISIPAFITATSGKKLNEITAAWDLKQINDLKKGQILLKTIALEGFTIGVTGFLLGLISIAIVFMRRIKKIHKIMEAEYSLENISLNTQEQAEENGDEDDSRWI